MTYRTILVDLTADGPVEARLDVARSLASRFDAVLVGVHVVPEVGDHEQGGQALSDLGRHGRGDLAMVAAVDESAGGAGDLEERAEGGQLVALPDQLLDRDVDDVGQVVPGARRRDAGPHGKAASLGIVTGNVEEAAHQRHQTGAVGRVVVAGKLVGSVRQPCRCADVGDDPSRNIGDLHEVAEALERLEEDQQRQA